MKKTLIMAALGVVSTFCAFAQSNQPELVKDLNTKLISSQPKALFIGYDHLYFLANGNNNGQELWAFDLKDSSYEFLIDLRPGVLGSSEIIDADTLNGETYLIVNAAGYNLIKTDGTASATEVLARDVSTSVNLVDNYMISFNGEIYFSRDVDTLGKELWATDGSTNGLRLVKDIDSGAADGEPCNFIEYNGSIIFGAKTTALGREMWSTDGTTAGTKLVYDLDSASTSSYPRLFTKFDGKLYFKASGKYNGGNVSGLFMTDGTDTGTSIVLMADTQTINLSSDVGNRMVECQGLLYFTAYRSGIGIELGRTDGTQKGTYMIDISSGTYSSSPSLLTSSTTGLYFVAEDEHGRELFYSEGTSATTKEVKDLYPIQTDNRITEIVAIGAKVYFPAHEYPDYGDVELFSSVGGSITKVKEIEADKNGSSPRDLVAYNGRLIFTADDYISGREIWISNGTSSGTKLYVDVNPQTGDSKIQEIGAIPGGVIFNAITDDIFDEPFIYNFSSDSVKLLKDYDGSSDFGGPRNFTAGKEGVFYSIRPSANYQELGYYKFGDGSLNHYSLTSGSDYLNEFVYVPGNLFFTRRTSFNPDVWHFDETSNKTSITRKLNPNGLGIDAKYLTRVGNGIYFSGEEFTYGIELYYSDGTSNGTYLVKDIKSGTSDSRPNNFCSFLDRYLLFTAAGSDGNELMISDRSSAGTKVVLDITPGSAGTSISNITEGDSIAYFSVSASTGQQLWKTDGTGSGTSKLVDLSNTRTGHPLVFHFNKKSGLLYMVVEDTVHGAELWVSNGTDTGTYLLKEIRSGMEGASIGEIVSVKEKIYFTANDSIHGQELWISDGTDTGTKMVVDFFKGVEGSNPAHLTLSGDILYFTADHGSYGNEMFRLMTSCLAGSVKVAKQCIGDEIEVKPEILFADSKLDTYQWTLNGSAITTDSVAKFTLDSLGTNTISVQVKTVSGCENEWSTDFSVYPYPSPVIYIDRDSQCLTGNKYRISGDASPNSTSYEYEWNYGDNTTGTSISTYKTYTTAGTKTVKFTAKLEGICASSVDTTLYVIPKPSTSAINGPTTSRKPIETYTATSKPDIYYQWTVTGGTILSGQGTNSVEIEWTVRPGSAVVKLKEIGLNNCEGNEVSKSITTAWGVGIEDISEGIGLSVFPNPGSGRFTIQTEQPLSDAEVCLINTLGEVVYRAHFSSLSQETVALQLAGGTYTLRVTSSGRVLNRLVIVQ